MQILEDDLVKGLCGACAGMIVTVVKFRRKCHRINDFMKSMKVSLEKVKKDDIREPKPIQVESNLQTERPIEAPSLPNSISQAVNHEIPAVGKRRRKFYSRKGIPSNDPGLCDICGGHFSYLRSHKLIHQEYLKYSCEICGRRFRNVGNFRLHKLRHKEPRFSCHTCGKMFYIKPKLLRHLMTHTGERPHACTLCEKKFREKRHLQVHFRIHTGEKPHACSICDARFTTSAGVAQHKKHNHR